LDLEKLKQAVAREVDAHQEELIELSLRIHQNPELSFQEANASNWLSEYVGGNGFKVEKGICQLSTAFRGEYGSGKPRIALLAEYDALPIVGHGCGHNVIAASAVGAAVAARVAVDQLGGSVVIIGTPAEELYAAKEIMVRRGAFEAIDAAMMIHAGVQDIVGTETLACITLDVEFFGKSAHAAAHPEEGINALEAMIQAFNGINSLRQHIRERARIHGIITQGGEAANVVPAYTSANFVVRAEDEAYLDELKEKVINCFRGASLATGARLEYKWAEGYYAPMNNNMVMAELFAENMGSVGRKMKPLLRRPLASTDMGNVSTVVPGIHPYVAIAPPEIQTHSPEFRWAAGSETGHRGLIDGAKALAMTVADLIGQPETMAKAREEFLASQ
jgi:amidohydrolase